jgi:hypothetical protein
MVVRRLVGVSGWEATKWADDKHDPAARRGRGVETPRGD